MSLPILRKLRIMTTPVNSTELHEWVLPVKASRQGALCLPPYGPALKGVFETVPVEGKGRPVAIESSYLKQEPRS